MWFTLKLPTYISLRSSDVTSKNLQTQTKEIFIWCDTS
jgi:hypothetical protein